MLFAFENIDSYLNFVDCPDVNSSGIERFGPCPIATRVIRESQQNHKYSNVDISNCRAVKITEDLENYIIPTSLNHSPSDWCGDTHHNDRKIIFEYLNKKYLADLQIGKAMLLLDQSHEGYQTKWLWEWFHRGIKKYEIPPESIIYVTGNLLARKQYLKFCEQNQITKKMNVLPYTHFEKMIHETGVNRFKLEGGDPLPKFEDHLEHKSKNKIKDYNFLQKRLRSHRTWGYKSFRDGGIIPNGLLSMNNFDYMQTHMQGRFISQEETEEINKELPAAVYGIPNNLKTDDFYITRFNDDVMLDTWISVVSEASFADTDNTCFLSEKSFKPIACYHPFIIFGNKHSLRRLRDLGYKTFHPYIDETYDGLETWDRLNAIVKSLQEFNKIENKMEWYKSLSDILHHNAETLHNNSRKTLPSAVRELDHCYRKYFNVR